MKPDNRGPIVNVNYGKYYTHNFDGNGHYTVIRSPAGAEDDYLHVQVCNGGSKSEPDNCRDYTCYSPV